MSETGEDIYSMTKTGYHEALRQAREQAWDEGADAEFSRSVLGNAKQENPHRSQK